MPTTKNNYFSIAKGIGIFLMVVGHCGAPDLLVKFIYEFHMPLFFFCSGYFIKNINSIDALFQHIKKRFKGIYLKFVCWSIFFLLLHNIFYHLNIYNNIILFRGQPSYLYSTSDFIHKASKIIFSMNEHEQLLRSFWFLKQLFLAGILVSSVIYLTNKLSKHRLAHLYIFFGGFILTYISKLYNWSAPAIWDISLVFMSSTFYYSGFIFRNYNILEKTNRFIISLLCLVILMLGLFFLPWTNMLEYTKATTIPFCFIAFSGILLTLTISQIIERCKIKHLFYYLGQNTMVILALHMLCFKLGNLLKIAIYNWPIYRLAEFQVINDHNTLFWIVYTIIGIFIPLFVDSLMKSTRYTKKIWNFFV